MDRPHCYSHPRPAVTVDVVTFGRVGPSLRVLLIKRGGDPFSGRWALPGGFLEPDEPVDVAARRELFEETGVGTVDAIEPIGAFGDPGRDPRGWTVSLAFGAILGGELPIPAGGDDAREAAWMDPDTLDALAFDHAAILATARRWLSRGIKSGPLGLSLLPDPFDPEDVDQLLGAAGIRETDALKWLVQAVHSGRIAPSTLKPACFGKITS